ncbi:MAG: serine/threonine protein kinase, partial [Planctomycetes bacterium]|nr:serine/threonine protein kinase [Planctomycetota bacterium]
MVEPPSKQLLDTLLNLKLCTRRDLFRCRGRVRRLARDLPAFDFVWIDSLLYARKLTPFQARLLEASDYERLCAGPCVLMNQLGTGNHSSTYLARQRDGRRHVVLKLIDLPAESISSTLSGLEKLVSSAGDFKHPYIVAPHAALQHNNQLVTLSRHVRGTQLSELFVRRGRFGAEIVLEIGRQLVDGLAALEEKEYVHGDIRLSNVILTASGAAVIVDAGIEPVVAGPFSFHTDRPPHRFDGIAPELIGTGNHANSVSDIYALGCLLWQLLAGRPPFPTNDPLAKLACHQTREVADVREWAPDTPAPLAEAIKSFTQKDPVQRPQSFHEIREKWGSPGRRSRRRLAKFRARFNTAAPRIPVDVSDESSRRWPITVALLLVLCGTTTLFLLDQGARNQLLHWGKSSLSWLDQNSGASSEKEQQQSSSRLRSLPEPNSDGLIQLDAHGPYHADVRNFVGSLTIRGTDETQSIIVVSEESFRLVAERVTLENVHLRPAVNAVNTEESEEPNGSGRENQTLLSVHSQHLVIRNCSFENRMLESFESSPNSSAILWRAIDLQDPAGSSVSLQNTMFTGDSAAIHFATTPYEVQISNCLKLGRGTMLEFASTPKAGRELQLSLQQLTLRGSGELLAMQIPENPAESGRISIEAVDCVFDFAEPRTPLFLFQSHFNFSHWLKQIKMTGKGSLAKPGLRIAQWMHPETGMRAAIEKTRIE